MRVVLKLEIINLSKKFGSFTALEDVSFIAKKGEFITLLGPSGCGKTTLLNMIAGFLSPTNGMIKIDGEDVSNLPPEKRDTAMCFQSYALFPHLTVEQNIKFGLKQKKLKKSDVDDQSNSMLKKVSLEEHSNKLPNALSGGQQQRVALARALVVMPGIVLFDEPLSNLDAKLRDQVRLEIRALQEEFGFTAIYVTHDQSEALAMSDKIILLNNGKVEQIGTPHDIYFHPKTKFTADFIGTANIHQGEMHISSQSDFLNMNSPFGVIKSQVSQKTDSALPAGLFCWRPEVARFTGLEDGSNANSSLLSGRVASLTFQGAYTDIFISAGEETIRIQSPQIPKVKIGDEIEFFVPTKSIVCIEGEQA